jgi:peptidoglycan/xylan/chitin deacetylase (PgdA/CDA1 family)
MSQLLHDIPILTYHKISSRLEIGLNTLPPHQFRQQMIYLKDQGFQTITFRDIFHQNIPPLPLIITFDDGYASVYQQALPVLQEVGFRAVVFIITDYIGKANTWDANLFSIKFFHLDESQVTALAEAGMEIGSHGVTHRALPFLPFEQLESELRRSRERLTALVGKEIITFAYPFGIQNPVVQKAVQQAGYSFACVNMRGAGRKANQYCLPRIPVYRTDSMSSFRHKLSPGFGRQLEISKLRLISWPARLTPLYQKFFKKLYRS